MRRKDDRGEGMSHNFGVVKLFARQYTRPLDHQIDPPIRQNGKLGSPTAYLRAKRAGGGDAERVSASEKKQTGGTAGPSRPHRQGLK